MRVVYSRRAVGQLEALYAYIAGDSPQRAERFVSAIVDYCDGLDAFPLRGAPRDDIRPGLRIVGFRRRVTIAFTVDDDAVTILGVLYGGRDLLAALSEGEDDPE